MDLSEDSKVLSTPLKDHEEKVEPGELLEEGWFFGNLLLDRKTRMSRCFSDPCPSSKVSNQEMLVGQSYEETYSSINKLQQNTDHHQYSNTRPNLIKAPSMPSSMARQVSPVRAVSSYLETREKEGDQRKVLLNKSRVVSPGNNNMLHRAPSMPLCVDMDEDEESDYSMGRLIRQASMGHSEVLPPRRTSSKTIMPSTVPRHRPRRKPELESIKTEGSSEDRRRQIVLNHSKSRKNLAQIESKELGFSFDKKELNSNVSNYSNIPLLRQKSTPPVLDNVGNNKSAEDMKAQIKFWARAVASNVR